MAFSNKIQNNRNELVNKIIKDIKSGKPFFWNEGFFNAEPKSLICTLRNEKRLYKGINNLFLTVSAYVNGFKDSRWATFKQIEAAGYKLKKGSKGTHIEYWQYTIDAMEVNPKTGKKEPIYEIDETTGKKRKIQLPLKIPIVKNYVVFNAEQIEGIELETSPKINHKNIIKDMENMLQHSEAKIYYDQNNRNYYSPSTDEIHVVPRDKFYDINDFYATCAHEIAHSTGAKHRLNRKSLIENDGFGNTMYAKEELRAELTSMFLNQKYNIKFNQKHYENHAAYLQNWVDVLKNDPNEIFRAATEAEKAMTYIEEKMINVLNKNLDNNLEVEYENIDNINKKIIDIIQSNVQDKKTQSTAKQYLAKAKNLLKENDNIWRKDFDYEIVEALIAEGRTPNAVKLAIKKYSPYSFTLDDNKLSKLIKLNQKGLSR